MGILILEAIGENGELLAVEAGAATGIAVGFDPDLESATFDSETLDDKAVKETVLAALAGIYADWQAHLRVVE